MDKREIKIHYNAFDNIKEQLEHQGFTCKDIKFIENLKDCILKLWFHELITDNEKAKIIMKLNKKIISNLKKLGDKNE